MITMKKTAMAAALFATLGAAAAQAAPVVNFAFTGNFTMRDSTGVTTGGNAIVGAMNMDMGTGAGDATIGMATPGDTFFGYTWTAHNITMQATGPGTVHANMLFDWGTTTNISVGVEFSMTPTAWVTSPYVDAYQFAVATLDGPGADGIPGNPMDNGPFVGFNAAFDGTATVTGMCNDCTISPPPSNVPVPAAAWLLGSGLLGMVGVARRRKYA